MKMEFNAQMAPAQKPGKENIIFREIAHADNAALANVIRRVMEEFKIDRPGTIYVETSTDHLFELFQCAPRSTYFVVELNGAVAGGAGIFPTDELPGGVCELVKMYLTPVARGKGVAKELISRCLETAKELGYHSVYLESMPELKQALRLYEYFGFQYLDKPLGNSQHTSTSIWMVKTLS